MKYKSTLLLFVLSALLWSCETNEDPIKVDAVPYKREAMYDTLSADPTLKYISTYYYRYDKILITDPDSSDYWYNFSSSYKTTVGITMPTTANAAATVKTLDELLIKWYTADFIRKHFPKSILIGDNVFTYTNSTTSTTKVPVDMYSGAYFLLIKSMNVDTMSVATKKIVAQKLNNILWSNIVKFRPFMTIENKFFETGNSNTVAKYESTQTSNEWTGGKTYDPAEFQTNKTMYQYGFVTCKREYGTYFGKPYISKVILPSQADDLSSWFTFILTTSDADIQALKTKYALNGTTANPTIFEIKFNILAKAFSDAGLDYRTLGYKP